jgi:SAM-dependent methyltransferase
MTVLDEQLIDALGSGSPAAEQILRWPDGFVESVDAWLLALQAGKPLSPEALADLGARELVGGDSVPTPLGRRLIHYLLLRECQAGDEQFQSFMGVTGLGPDARVLDVGCGMGQTLGALAARRPAESVGVDTDLEVLAFGRRLDKREGGRIGFVRATAHALPFGDQAFTHVICRNALTYMHHRRALTEMARVLRPGGFLYLRVENLRYDLRCLCHPAGIRGFCRRLRDFPFGLLNALVGWQATPGGALGVGRAFASPRRLKGILSGWGCEIVRTEESIRCPRFLGGSTQTSLLARKGR